MPSSDHQEAEDLGGEVSDKLEGATATPDDSVDPPQSAETAASRQESEELSEVTMFRKKTLILLALSLAISYPLLTLLDVWYASTRSGNASGDAAIVLGAAQYNGRPSPVFRGRLDRSAELFESGSVRLIVVTGGAQEGDISTEANAGYAYLRSEAGLADEDLRLEVQGASTYESLAATARFLETEEVSRVVLVTDPFHAKRASLIAEEVGLRVEVALTAQPLTLDRLLEETAAVGVGRVISFRRLQRFTM